jgi:hypothetical protein
MPETPRPQPLHPRELQRAADDQALRVVVLEELIELRRLAEHGPLGDYSRGQLDLLRQLAAVRADRGA